MPKSMPTGPKAEGLLQCGPASLQLVLLEGEVKIAAPHIDGYQPNVVVDGEPKYLTGNISRLKRRIARRLKTGLAEVSQTRLWQLLLPDERKAASR